MSTARRVRRARKGGQGLSKSKGRSSARGASRNSKMVVIDPPGPTIEHNAYKLGQVGFEELCCALLRTERHMSGADLYGRPRQSQYGVDIVGTRRDGRGIEVVSCKCYLEVSKGEIDTFVADFLQHWKSHWKAQRVRRFVLAIPADLRSHERRVELKGAEQRFKKLSVRFDVWHKRELTHRIRRDADIRREFFGEWVPTSPAVGAQRVEMRREAPPTSTLSAVMVSQIHELQSALGESVGAQLDRYTEVRRRGEKADIDGELAKLRGSKSRWESLTPDVQARVLRMQALNAMDEGSLARADRLLNDADVLAPKDGVRFHALLAYRQHGPERGLRVLGKPERKEEALVQAALLMESGRPSNAISTLRQWQSVAKDDPEWRRLIACATFSQGQRSVGLEHIREAERRAPEWTSVIRMGAILRYGAALSPAAGFRITRLPEPVHPDLVLRDDDSQELLHEALTKFELLGARNLSQEDRDEIEAWKLACLANLIGREKEASALCVSLVKRRPPSTAAVFWGLARGYPINRGALSRRLETNLRSKARNVDDLQALVACLFVSGETEAARRALTRHSSRFTDASSKRVIATWRERLSIKTAKRVTAAARREPYVALERLMTQARESGNWSAIEPFLRSIEYAPAVVFAACQALASHRQWPDVVAHADRLIDSVGSAEATRLAVYAWYNTGSFDRVLDALEQYKARFPSGGLPQDLQRLKAYAKARQGDLVEARTLAAKLARETQQPKDELFAAQLHIRGGDISGALPFVRDAVGRHEGKPKQLLQLVPSVFNEDPELARQLLQRALAQGLKPHEGAFALGWAYKLGLQKEANELLKDLAAQEGAAKGVFRSASLDEVIAYMRQRQEAAATMTRLYERGEGPIHAIASALNVNLARIWRNAFENGDARIALLVRHGNRSTDFFPSAYPSQVALALDITALLTAEWLGLLDIVEGSTVALALPNSVMGVLQYLEQEAHHHQPSRMETVQKVVNYADGHPGCLLDEIEPADAASSVARVVFELSKAEGGGVPRITLGALGAELVRRGGTTAEEFARVGAQLAGWATSSTETDAQAVRTLIFEHNTIDAVVDAGLLDAVTTRFEVRMQAEHYQSCIAELREYREREALAERLRRLRRRIAQGIDRGRYTFLPRPGARKQRRRSAISSSEMLLEPLFELLGLEQATGHWIWVDDRFCTGFTNAHGNTIVSVYEVLRYLNDTNALSAEAFYMALGALRRANVMFLPITVSEVLYRLDQAQLGDEGVIETRELADLRIALNQLLHLEPDLDLELSGGQRDKPPEVHALVIAFRIARDCLEEIWRARDIPVATCLAKSDWVWEALRVERFLRVPPGGDEEARRKLWLMTLVHLLSIGVSVPVQRDNEVADGALKAFNWWLKRNLVDLGEHGDHAALDEMGVMLSELLLGILTPLESDGEHEDVSSDDVRRVLTRFTESLPPDVRWRVYEAPGLQAALRPELITVVNLGELAFEAKGFWTALEAAWDAEEAMVTAVRCQRFRVRRDGDGVILSGDTNVRFTDPDLELLTRDVATRRELVRQRQAVLTDAANEIDTVVAQVATPSSPFERMKRVRELRESVAASRYARLSELLDAKEEFAASELLPTSADRYLAFLGLSRHASEQPDWGKMAKRQVAHLGFTEALLRWAGIPIRLPSTLIEDFFKLDATAAEATVDALRQEAVTPLRRLKLLQLLCDSEQAGYQTMEESLLGELFATWQTDARAFNAVLQWSERVWQRNTQWRVLPVAHRLACVWAHADRVFSMFAARRIGSGFVEERFDELHSSSMRELLPFDVAYESDAAAPKRMSMEALLVFGLNAALGKKSGSLLQGQRASFLGLVTMQIEQGPFPVAGLFADRRSGTNALDAFFTAGLDSWYSEQILAGGIRLLSEGGREEMRMQAVGLVTTQPTNPSAWMQVSMVGVPWLPTEARMTVDEALKRFTFAGTDDDATRMAHVLATIAPYCGSSVREPLIREVITWARKLSRIHTASVVGASMDTPGDRAAVAVIELAVALSRAQDLRQTLLSLDRIVQEVVVAWPALTTRLRDIVARTLRECTWQDGAALWRAFVALRRRR